MLKLLLNRKNLSLFSTSQSIGDIHTHCLCTTPPLSEFCRNVTLFIYIHLKYLSYALKFLSNLLKNHKILLCHTLYFRFLAIKLLLIYQPSYPKFSKALYNATAYKIPPLFLAIGRVGIFIFILIISAIISCKISYDT